MYIYKLKNVALGAPVILPDNIKNSKAINALVRDENHHRDYDDQKCFFRCLALHQGASIYALEGYTTQLKRDFEQHTKRCYDSGVDMSQIPALEVHFKVSINIYALQQDGTGMLKYLSNLTYNTMHLNLYENHFSYIKHFSKYAKRYICSTCRRVFTQTDNLKRHAKTCSTDVCEIYIGGKYRNKKSIFEELDAIDINVPEKLRHYPMQHPRVMYVLNTYRQRRQFVPTYLDILNQPTLCVTVIHRGLSIRL